MIEHQLTYHPTTSEEASDFGGDDAGNDMFSDSGGGGDNQQHYSTSTTNIADDTTTVVEDCIYDSEITKTYPEYEQLMADAYAANIDIINKRGTSILSLFQPQDYINVEDHDIVINEDDTGTAESSEITANLLSYLEVVEDNGEV